LSANILLSILISSLLPLGRDTRFSTHENIRYRFPSNCRVWLVTLGQITDLAWGGVVALREVKWYQSCWIRFVLLSWFYKLCSKQMCSFAKERPEGGREREREGGDVSTTREKLKPVAQTIHRSL
jgi:hypothetical protein